LFSAAAAAARGLAGAVSSALAPIHFPPGTFQGGGVVDQTGPYLLHEGERVLTRGDTQMLDGRMAAPEPTTPALGLPGGGGPASVDNSINVGGVSVTIHTERVDSHTADLLSDELVRKLQDKLAALRTEQHFRQGVRTPGAA
jgi:hypothetical protein